MSRSVLMLTGAGPPNKMVVTLEPTVPWEISIINGTVENRTPLGPREDVIAAFADSLPGVKLQRRPTPPPEMLEQMPPVVREAVLRPSLEADFESGDLSIQFYANDEPVLHWVNGEVRGNGDPVPVLAAICLSRGWFVLDSSNGSVVDLSSVSGSAGWERFCEWRDKVISEARQADK